MNVIQTCLSRPVAVSVGVLLVILFGLLSVLAIPVQLTPNVDVPLITVTTNWPGANPQEVEREIIDRQEEYLRSVKGLRKLTSTAQDNFAQVELEFYTGMDKAEALRDVNDKLRQVTGYPLEVKEPTVVAADPSINSPIAWLVLYPQTADGTDESVTYMRDFVEDNVKPYLDRVQGVAGVEIYGGREREVQVRIDAGALAARGLTFRQVELALRRQNANVSAGTHTQGKRDYAIRTVGQYESPEEILSTVIAYTPGGPVYVKDVAEVSSSFKKQTSMVRSKGRYVLALPVRREVGANVIQVMQRLRDAVLKVNEEVLAARKMKIELTQIYDETVYIRQAIRMVVEHAGEGGLLTVIVLMLFLRNWRATAAVALSIPISVIGTFVVMAGLGRTLNVISLAGIAFSIGMVVDDSIVVLENVYRHRQMGKDVVRAVLDGTSEVWAAVLASTLTTLAVFVPVIFVAEEAGQLFRDISIATAVSVGLSLFVSVMVMPPLASKLLRIGRGGHGAANPKPNPGAPGQNPKWEAAAAHSHTGSAVGRLVASIVARVNRHRGARLAVIVVMTVGSLASIPFLVPDATYLPTGNRNMVFGFLFTPPGYSLEEFKRMAGTIEAGLQPYWEAEPGSAAHRELDQKWREQIEPRLKAGTIPDVSNPKLSALERNRARREWLTPPPLLDNFFYVAYNGGCFMGATSRDEARVKPMRRLLEVAGGQIPGVIPVFMQAPIFNVGGGNDLEIQIRGDNLEKVTAAAEAVQMACMAPFGFARPSPANYSLGRPEVRIVPDRERAADLGLNVTDVGFIVSACGSNGAYVGDFRQAGGRTIYITLYVKGQQDRPTQEIAQVPISTPSGRIVPLEAAVKLLDTTALEQINHVERQRAVTLSVSPPETIALEGAIRQIRDEIEPKLREGGQIDPSVMISITGNADKLVAARTIMVGQWQGFTLGTLVNMLGSRFFLSVLICYLVMVALYESWLYPFVIMFSVPLAIFGGFVGLSLAHLGTLLTTDQPIQQLDVLTFLGFIILVGIVVKNAILLVDQTLQNLRLHGMSSHEAIRAAVTARVRPVLMTSLATVFGQLPLAVIPGAGTELYRGLAAVCVGGMLIATFGTLVLVPAVLSLVLDLRARVARPVPGGVALPVPATAREP